MKKQTEEEAERKAREDRWWAEHIQQRIKNENEAGLGMAILFGIVLLGVGIYELGKWLLSL